MMAAQCNFLCITNHLAHGSCKLLTIHISLPLLISVICNTSGLVSMWGAVLFIQESCQPVRLGANLKS
jgi:hypothetical protein